MVEILEVNPLAPIAAASFYKKSHSLRMGFFVKDIAYSGIKLLKLLLGCTGGNHEFQIVFYANLQHVYQILYL